jgi:hypothetical protein
MVRVRMGCNGLPALEATEVHDPLSAGATVDAGRWLRTSRPNECCRALLHDHMQSAVRTCTRPTLQMDGAAADRRQDEIGHTRPKYDATG